MSAVHLYIIQYNAAIKQLTDIDVHNSICNIQIIKSLNCVLKTYYVCVSRFVFYPV